MAGRSALPPLLLLHRSFLAQQSSVFRKVKLIAFVLYEMRVLQSVDVFYASHFFTENKVPFLLSLLVIFCVVILAFCKFLEANSCLILKMDSDICDSFIGPRHSLTLRFCCVLKPCASRLDCHFHVCDFTAWLSGYSAYIRDLTTMGARD